PPGPTGECEECRQKRLQRKSRNSELTTWHDSPVPEIVHEVLRSSGQSLDPATRAFMEPRFGHDFSRVRVHTDETSAESARSVNALAYTVENQVVFAQGQYVPHTSEGRHLIAHELAHVIQQGDAESAGAPVRCSNQSSSQEHEATAAA